MFILKDLGKVDFQEMLKRHLLYVATSDVYYQNAVMLNGHHKILDFKTYNEYWKNFLNDIELVTEPIDAFVPSFEEEEGVDVKEEDRGLFMVNRVGPEYEKIKNRCTYEEIKKTLPPTHDVMAALMEDASKITTVVDDIYIYWSMTKYLQNLDTLRLQILSNMTPGIEYVVTHIDEAAIKRHMHSGRKINIEKFNKTLRELFFRRDYQFTKAFYDAEHENFPHIDVEMLMQRLITNIDTKPDYGVIIAIYLTMSFAMTDIKNNNIEESQCAKYVRDVLSKF